MQFYGSRTFWPCVLLYICRWRLRQFAIGLLVCLRLVGVCLFVDLRLMALIHTCLVEYTHRQTRVLCIFFIAAYNFNSSVNVYTSHMLLCNSSFAQTHTHWMCVCLCRVLMRRLTCMESLSWYWTVNIHVFARTRTRALAIIWRHIQFIFRMNTCEVLFSFVALHVLVRMKERNCAYTV